LKSQGDLIIGESGEVVGDINNMKSLLIDGKLVGNVSVDRVCIRGQAQVFGNITCKSVQIDPTAIIVGTLNVHGGAPKVIDSDGNEVKPAEVHRKNIPAAAATPAPASAAAAAKKPEPTAAVDGEKVIADELAAAAKAKQAEEDKKRSLAKKKEEEDMKRAAEALRAEQEATAAAEVAAETLAEGGGDEDTPTDEPAGDA
jgi:type IV secretory pathway VirB10-like protein